MAEPKPPVNWSPEARNDLADIWNYYMDAAGRHTAEKIVRDITHAVELLRDHPFGGRARAEIRPALRSLAVNPHVLFYRVADDVAEIVRVIDGRRDIEGIFAEPSEEP